jgi:hypothetical protein
LIGKTQKVICSSTAVMNVPPVRLFEGHSGHIHTMMFASVGLAAPNLFKLSGLNSAQAHQQNAVSTFDPRALRCSMTKITREG